MGRQIEEIISSLGPLTGGTASINMNLVDIEALLTTLQADVADGISVTGTLSTVGTVAQINNVNSVGTMTVLTSGSVAVTNGTVAVTGTLSTVGTVAQLNNVNSIGTMAVLTSGSIAVTNGTIAQLNNINSIGTMAVLTSGSVAVTNGTITPKVSTTGGTGPTTFTSTSYGTITTANTARLGCTLFNEGAGRLHATLGTAATSTTSYTVSIGSGEYYEVPMNYTGLIGGIFATAGTARVTVLS